MAIFVGTPGTDHINGTEDADEIYGMGGENYLDGRGGDDYIDSGDGDPNQYNSGGYVDGGVGADTMIGGEGAHTYTVDNVNDVVIDTGTALGPFNEGDSIWTYVNYVLPEGIENVSSFVNTVTSITGNSADNTVSAFVVDQDMEIHTLGGNDTIYAFNFSDEDSGHAFAYGGAGDDRYIVAPDDVIVELEDEGIDTVQGAGRIYTLPENVENLEGGGASGPGQQAIITGNDLDNTITIYSAVRTELDEIYGLGGNDHIRSSNSSLRAEGGDGNDTLLGNANLPDWDGAVPFDVLIGGAGDDLLSTGGGDDDMTGGVGADRFEIQVSGGNATVHDFDADVDRLGFAESDTVVLSSMFDASMVHFGTVATTAAQRFVFDAASGAMYFDGDGNGGGAQTQIADINVVGGTFDFNDLYIAPTPGINVINGTNGDDTISGTDEDDEINAGGGDDLVIAEDGDDQVFGGDGNDELRGSTGADVMFGDAGNDVVNGSDGRDIVYGGSGNDTLLGQGDEDTLDGGAGADRMEGGEFGDTYIVDNAGDRVVETATRRTGGDEVQASINYTLTANVETLTLVGAAINGTGNGDDNRMHGNELANRLRGADGDDVVYGNDGNDTLDGEAGDDVLSGGVGSDTLNGGGGHDSLYGTEEFWWDAPDDGVADRLNGGGGNDELYAGANDVLAGGAGNDIYHFVDASNVLIENSGEGTDKVEVSDQSFTLASNFENLQGDYSFDSIGLFNLTGNSGANEIEASIGLNGPNVNVYGLGGNDNLRVNGTNLIADGGVGNDSLASDAWDDTGVGNTLIGGAGNDHLEDYGGSNIFTGGTGDDTFHLNLYYPGAVNTITDFNGSDDALTIRAGALAGLEDEGPLSASEFYAGSAATTATQRLIYDASAGALYYDSDGNGAAAQELIVNLTVASGTFNHQDIDIVA